MNLVTRKKLGMMLIKIIGNNSTINLRITAQVLLILHSDILELYEKF
jgi:hypothetical protein